MSFDRTVDVDAFASAIGGIMDEVTGNVKRGARGAVREGARVAKSEWSANAPRDTGRYAGSISFRVMDKGEGPTAEIGSATLPGLPHLLEKPHALVGGGSSTPQVHIAPAAEDAFEATMAALGKMEL